MNATAVNVWTITSIADGTEYPAHTNEQLRQALDSISRAWLDQHPFLSHTESLGSVSLPGTKPVRRRTRAEENDVLVAATDVADWIWIRLPPHGQPSRTIIDCLTQWGATITPAQPNR